MVVLLRPTSARQRLGPHGRYPCWPCYARLAALCATGGCCRPSPARRLEQVHGKAGVPSKTYLLQASSSAGCNCPALRPAVVWLQGCPLVPLSTCHQRPVALLRPLLAALLPTFACGQDVKQLAVKQHGEDYQKIVNEREADRQRWEEIKEVRVGWAG